MSILTDLYPHLAPGLCGELECRELCYRWPECPAADRRRQDQHARRVRRHFTVTVDRARMRRCERIHDAGLCPYICRKVGGCFLPRVGDHPAEALRKVYRAQRAADELVRHRAGVVR